MGVSLTYYVVLFSTCIPVQIWSTNYVCLSVDVYDVDSLSVGLQDIYFPDTPSSFIFDVDVYNMSPMEITASSGEANFMFRVRNVSCFQL